MTRTTINNTCVFWKMPFSNDVSKSPTTPTFFPYIFRFPANTNGGGGKASLSCERSWIVILAKSIPTLFTEVSHSALESILCQCGGIEHVRLRWHYRLSCAHQCPGCRWQSRPDRRHLLNSWEDRVKVVLYGMPVILSFVPFVLRSQWPQQSLTATSITK